MNTEFLHYIRPYIIATQCIVSGRKIDLDEIVTYCRNPASVEQSGRKNLYKVYSDLFNLYKVDAPSNIYSITPQTLNNYASVYAKYVLKKDVQQFTEVIGWENVMKDMYDLQRGSTYQLLTPMLQMKCFGEHTLEIGVFICNILALALNSQVIILTPATYNCIVQYSKCEQWEATDELLHFYCRYREFLDREFAFAYYVYIATVQFGYPDPMAPDGTITYCFTSNGYTIKAKYNSGTCDWLLTVYGTSKSPIGAVSYTHVTTRCRATGSITSDILAKLWYTMPDHISRTVKFDTGVFSRVLKYVNNAGKRMPLVVQHLRDNYVSVCGEYTVIVYRTGWSSCIHVRRDKVLLGVVEYGNGDCFASNTEIGEILSSISLTGETNEDPLVTAFDRYFAARYDSVPTTHAIITDIVDLLHQHGVTGLDAVRDGLCSSKA